MSVTKDQFFAYEAVKNFGAWNMFDKNAILASGLDDDTYQEIMYKYNKLKKKFVRTDDYDDWVRKEEKRINEIVDKINIRHNE